jgi:hypothetical protein
MFCVRRDKDVAPDVDACTRAFLQGDDRQPIQKVIQDLLAFGRRLCRDTISYLGGRIEDRATVADLSEAAQDADCGSGAEGQQVSAGAGSEVSIPDNSQLSPDR